MQIAPEVGLSAQKYKFLRSKGCQRKSPNIILLEKITKQLPKKCAYPCHWNTSKWSLGKTMNKIIAHLPVCRNIEEENCMLDVANEVQNQPSNIDMKQCTRLQYAGITNRLIDNQQSDQVVYDIVFATPVKVNVKEEYLIYDGVAMISAIGGTLGLCIGFSFYNLASFFTGWLENRLLFLVKREEKLDHQ